MMIAADIAGLSLPVVLLCVVLALIGSTIQGTLGFGLGMLTSPIFAMIDPSFVPAALMVAVLPLTVGVAARDRAHIDSTGFKWALLGRFPGVFIGVVALRAMSHDTLAYAVSSAVLFAVLVSMITARRGQVIPTNSSTLTGAGFASGFMGTVTGIGGPPIALVYSSGEPVTVRATISAFFTIGAAISVAGLVLSGAVGRHELALTAVILPGVFGGLAVSSRIGHLLPAQVMRPLILTLCAFSGSLLLLRTAL